MEPGLVRCGGCGTLSFPGTLVVSGFGRSRSAASRGKSSSLSVTFLSNYVGLYPEPRTLASSSTQVFKQGNFGPRLSKFRCRPRRLPSGGSRLVRWRAGGTGIIPSVSGFWEGVKNPLLQSIQDRGIFASKQQDAVQNTEAEAETRVYFSEARTVDARFSTGELSTAAIDCIEQFSRLNGLSGKKMRSNFEASAPVAIQNEARNLVEFTCFRYLARCNADLHPSLKDAAFRRLTFSAMLAWQRPYKEDIAQNGTIIRYGLPRIGLVGEDAFTRIAPAIAGVADHAVAHCLYHTLLGDSEGLSFDTWDRYCSELCKIQKGRDQQMEQEGAKLGLEEGECIVWVGSDSRQPVQKWSKNTAWPGRLTLTDRALYFEANGLTHHQKPTRLDLKESNCKVEKKKVGPFAMEVFDSAIALYSSSESEPWILEFVDFGGEGRRNAWHAVIKEILAVYSFIAEFGVDKDDPFVNYIYGAKNGVKKIVSLAVMGIARLHAVHATLGKFPVHPEKLLQFSYLENAPSGELVRQALAVASWGGRMEAKPRDTNFLAMGGVEIGVDDAGGFASNLIGTDGTVYLRSWAKSPTWTSGKSSAFWRTRAAHRGLVLGKNHVVGGQTQIERAVRACQDQANIAEKTQATIDGALLKGIPSNVDLLQELLLPFSIAAVNFGKLKKWENPGASVTFLFFVYGFIYMNWLQFVVPTILLTFAASLLTLRVLNTQGRLGNDFGKVTIREQPPTNTIQKIMALKEALTALEDFLQTSNIALLKLRTVALSREPRVTNEVLFALVGMGVAMLLIPFRYLFALFIADQFTVELKFREKSVQELFTHLRDWWNTIPVAPVVVLPPEKPDVADVKTDEGLKSKGEAVMEAMSEWLGEDSQISQSTGGAS